MTNRKTVESSRVKKARAIHLTIEKQEKADNSLRKRQKQVESYERVLNYLDTPTEITVTDSTTINKLYWPI